MNLERDGQTERWTNRDMDWQRDEHRGAWKDNDETERQKGRMVERQRECISKQRDEQIER
jgi:hypothetical protein